MSKDEEPELPSDILKEVVRKAGYSAKLPKKGDEVRIRYTAQATTSDGRNVTFDSTDGMSPYAFKLGIGTVFEAWDRAVATMKQGEVAKFTFPEMYLSGGPAALRESIPDCDKATYEIELVGVTVITDLFKDGVFVLTMLDDGEEYGRPPKMGDEIILRYELLHVDSQKILDSRSALEYKIGAGSGENLIQRKAIDAAAVTMKKGSIVELRTNSDGAFGTSSSPLELSIPQNSALSVKLTLVEICEVEDVGKKAAWPEGVIVKKAIRVVRNRLVPGLDGTWCKAKLLKVEQGDKMLLDEPWDLEFMPGRGELCDALECACARMRKGEVAKVKVRGAPDLHCPGKPEISTSEPDSVVVYHLEMLEFDNPPPEDGPSGDRDRILFCRTQKDRAAGHFKEGRIRLAQERYARVIELLPLYKRDGSTSLHVEFFTDARSKDEAEELRRTCRLNLAACSLKLEEFYRAKQFCSEVLQSAPENVKALYRRAQASLGTKDYDEALADCRELVKLDVSNAEARGLLQKIQKAKKEEDLRQKSLLAGKMQKF